MTPRCFSFFESPPSNTDNLVAQQLTDHPLLDLTIPLIGKKSSLRLFSLNILIPKSLIFEFTPEGVHTRLTFPMEWFIQEKMIVAVNRFLKKYHCLVKIITHANEQAALLLINRESGEKATQLPSNENQELIKRIALESPIKFQDRIGNLGKYIGKTLSLAKQNDDIIFFALQELQNDTDTIDYLLDTINSTAENLTIALVGEEVPDHVLHKSAILYDSSQVCLLEDNEKEETIRYAISSTLNTPSFIGHICSSSFKLINTYESILISSIHFNFLAINQPDLAKPSQKNIMEELDDVAKKHNVILVGDFNKKVDAEDELNHLSKAANLRQRNNIFISTESGLQPYDTIDAILAPVEYRCCPLEYKPSRSL